MARFTNVSREHHGSAQFIIRLVSYLPTAIFLLFPFSASLLRELIAPCASAECLGDDALLQRMRRFCWVWVLADIAIFSLSHTQLPSYIQAIAGGAAILFSLHLLGRDTRDHASISPRRLAWGRGVEMAVLTVITLALAAVPLLALRIPIHMAPFGVTPFPRGSAPALVSASLAIGALLLVMIWVSRCRRQESALTAWVLGLWPALGALLLVTACFYLQADYAEVGQVGAALRALPKDTLVLCYYPTHPESLIFYAGRPIEYFIPPEGNPARVSWLATPHHNITFASELLHAVRQHQPVAVVTNADELPAVQKLCVLDHVRYFGTACLATSTNVGKD